MVADSSQTVLYTGKTLFHVVVKAIVFMAFAIGFAPVMGYSPFYAISSVKGRPLVITLHTGRQAVIVHAPITVVGKFASLAIFGINDLLQVALFGVLVTV